MSLGSVGLGTACSIMALGTWFVMIWYLDPLGNNWLRFRARYMHFYIKRQRGSTLSHPIRGPNNHINTKIRGIPEITLGRIPMFMWSVGPYQCRFESRLMCTRSKDTEISNTPNFRPAHIHTALKLNTNPKRNATNRNTTLLW